MSGDRKLKINEVEEVALSGEEIFVIMCALEQFADIRDSEYRNVTETARNLLGALPQTDVVWADVES